MIDLFSPEQAKHDPGGRVRLRMAAGVVGDAGFSPCGRYRTWLSRHWASEHIGRGIMPMPYALIVGTNPSVAGALVDDPTIGRETSFARSWGMRGFVKCNLGDYCATKPKRLSDPDVEPCSPENLPCILSFAEKADCVVLAFGVPPKVLMPHLNRTIDALLKREHELWCLGTTKDGWPRHPLYVAGDTPLERWYPEDVG